MNANILYAPLLIISGILIAVGVIVVLTKFFNRIIKIFEFYPESRGILNILLKIIAWFVGIIIFLLFTRLALNSLGLIFTTQLIGNIIFVSPRYILALLIIICGFYISRIVRERAREYNFEFKKEMLMVIDFIVNMTFVFTALYYIGIDMLFFITFYTIVLWIIGIIVAMIISMTIGIPLGFSIYEKMKKTRRKKRGKKG